MLEPVGIPVSFRAGRMSMGQFDSSRQLNDETSDEKPTVNLPRTQAIP